MQGTVIKLFLGPCYLVVTHVLGRDDKFCWSIFLRKRTYGQTHYDLILDKLPTGLKDINFILGK